MNPETAPVEEPQATEEPVVVEPENDKPESDTPKPEGWDLVDFDVIPEEHRDAFQARFNRLYGQVKRNENVNKQLIEDNRKLLDRVSKIEETATAQSVAQQTAHLEQEYHKAFRAGDSAKALEITKKIARLEAAPPKPEPAPQESSIIPRDDMTEIGKWAQSREWIHDGSEYQGWGAKQLEGFYTDPKWFNVPIEQKLAEVDKRFNELTSPPKTEVLSSGTPPRQQKTKLTDAQKTVAVHMFPKLSRDEAIKKYAEGLAE